MTLTLPLTRRPVPRPSAAIPAPGAVMPDGTLLTACEQPREDHTLRAGTRAASVDDHGGVRLWRWTPGQGWWPWCEGEARPGRNVA